MLIFGLAFSYRNSCERLGFEIWTLNGAEAKALTTRKSTLSTKTAKPIEIIVITIISACKSYINKAIYTSVIKY